MCLKFIPKGSIRSNHLVNLALCALFNLFLLVSLDQWSVIYDLLAIRLDFRRYVGQNVPIPRLLPVRLDHSWHILFSVSDKNLLKTPIGYRFPSFCLCENVAPNPFALQWGNQQRK